MNDLRLADTMTPPAAPRGGGVLVHRNATHDLYSVGRGWSYYIVGRATGKTAWVQDADAEDIRGLLDHFDDEATWPVLRDILTDLTDGA